LEFSNNQIHGLFYITYNPSTSTYKIIDYIETITTTDTTTSTNTNSTTNNNPTIGGNSNTTTPGGSSNTTTPGGAININSTNNLYNNSIICSGNGNLTSASILKEFPILQATILKNVPSLS